MTGNRDMQEREARRLQEQERLRRENAQKKAQEEKQEQKKGGEKKQLTEQELAEKKEREDRAAAFRAFTFHDIAKQTNFKRCDGGEIPDPTSDSDANLSTDSAIKVERLPPGWYEATNITGLIKTSRNILIEEDKVKPFINDNEGWFQAMQAMKRGIGANEVTVNYPSEHMLPKDIDLNNLLRIVTSGMNAGVAVHLEDPRILERLYNPGIFEKGICKKILERSQQSIQAVRSNQPLNEAQDNQVLKVHSADLKTNADNLMKESENLAKLKTEDKESVKLAKVKQVSDLVTSTQKALDKVSSDLGNKTPSTKMAPIFANAVASAERAITKAEKAIAENKDLETALKDKAEFTKLKEDVATLKDKVAAVSKSAVMNTQVPEKRVEQKSAVLNSALTALEKVAEEVKKAPAGSKKEAAQEEFTKALEKVKEAARDLGNESNKRDAMKQVVLIEGTLDKAVKKVEELNTKNAGLFTNKDRGLAGAMEQTLKSVEAIAKPEHDFTKTLDLIGKTTDATEKKEHIEHAQDLVETELEKLKTEFVHYTDPDRAGAADVRAASNPEEDMEKLANRKERIESHMNKTLAVMPEAEKPSFKEKIQQALEQAAKSIKEKVEELAKKTPGPARPGMGAGESRN